MPWLAAGCKGLSSSEKSRERYMPLSAVGTALSSLLTKRRNSSIPILATRNLMRALLRFLRSPRPS